MSQRKEEIDYYALWTAANCETFCTILDLEKISLSKKHKYTVDYLTLLAHTLQHYERDHVALLNQHKTTSMLIKCLYTRIKEYEGGSNTSALMFRAIL